MPVAVIHQNPELVRQQHLFCKPSRKQAEPFLHLPRVKQLSFPHTRPRADLFKLRRQLPVVYNRSGDKLREKGYKIQVIRQRIMRRRTAHAVRHKGNLLKRKKTDSQRQRNMFERKLYPRQTVEIPHKKIIIFKIKQQPQIQPDPQHAKQRPHAVPAQIRFSSRVDARNRFADTPVSQHTAEYQQHVNRLLIAVKHQRKHCERRLRRPREPKSVQPVPQKQRDRQKQKYKHIRIKQHCFLSLIYL